MKKVAVTGGAGFIGSHLAEKLRERGYYVIIIDDLSVGKRKNIELLLSKSHIEFIEDSITNKDLLQKTFKDVHYVFHQAGITSVTRSVEDPLMANEINLTGTLNVLVASKDNGIRKVVYASSCAVYGDSPFLPKQEDMPPNPLSPYAVTKLAGEYYCQAFQQVYGLPTTCLRYFNVFGPKQNPESQYAAVIPNLINRVYKGDPPIIFGDGKQTRDFIFVNDVVEANILVAESNAQGVFNIGSSESIMINQLAKLIIALSGKHSEPIYREPRPGDIKHSLADISKAKIFGFEPKYSLEKGLDQTIKYLTFKEINSCQS